MAEQVRVGIVGASWWPDQAYLPGLQKHPRAQIAAICARNQKRTAELAAKYGIPQSFTDYRQMIEQAHLDALFVATPDDLHYPITIAALEAGLHVLCEKPLALDTEHAKVMVEKAQAAGVNHMVFFTYRMLPQALYVRQLLTDGYIGRCLHCDFQFLIGYKRDEQYTWSFDGRRANGILGDLGSHMIDLARCYVGEVAKVSAHLGTYIARPGLNGQPLEPANDAALLTLAFANGAQGAIQVSAVAQLADREAQQRITLYGEAGTLEMDLFNCTLYGARQGEDHFRLLPVPDEYWHGIDHDRPFGAWVWDFLAQRSVGVGQFIDAIVNDRPFAPNFHDGLKVQQVIDAAFESHRCGCWITVA